MDKLQEYLGYQPFEDTDNFEITDFHYSEPYGEDQEMASQEVPGSLEASESAKTQLPSDASTDIIEGKVMVLGDFIDTDAVSFPMTIQINT
jgi:hypothetical protein